MLNQAEINALKNPSLSHMAKSMYIFYLQPLIGQSNIQVDTIALSSLLISTSQNAPCNPTTIDIEHALEELESLNLIQRINQDEAWYLASIKFPLHLVKLQENLLNEFTMHTNWRPSANFAYIAQNAGLGDYSFSEEELNDFVTFWLESNKKRNQSAWERSFVKLLLKKRFASSPHNIYPPIKNAHRAYGTGTNNTYTNIVSSNVIGFNPYDEECFDSITNLPKENINQIKTIDNRQTSSLKALATGIEDYNYHYPAENQPIYNPHAYNLDNISADQKQEQHAKSLYRQNKIDR